MSEEASGAVHDPAAAVAAEVAEAGLPPVEVALRADDATAPPAPGPTMSDILERHRPADIGAHAAALARMRARPRTLPPVMRGAASADGPGHAAWPGEESPAPGPHAADRATARDPGSSAAGSPAGTTNDTASGA